MRVFGKKNELAEYEGKKEIYAVIFDNKGYIGVLSNGNESVLPMCEIENIDEANLENQIQNYFFKKYNINIEKINLVDKAVEFLKDDDKIKHIEYYYTGQVQDDIIGSCPLMWYSPSRAMSTLTHEAHSWIIRQTIENLIDL